MTAGGPADGTSGDRSDRYGSIVESLADGVFVLDPDGTVVFVTEAIETFLDIDRDTLLGETFEQLLERGLVCASVSGRSTSRFHALRHRRRRSRDAHIPAQCVL